MGKKSKMKEQRRNGDGKVMDLIHYTEDSYLEAFPQATNKDYLAYLLQDEEARVKGIEKEMNVYFSKIRRILIDDEYFLWLDENKLKNSPETRIRYGSTLSDEQVMRLWDKNQMEKTIVTKTLPFMLQSKQGMQEKNFSLTDELSLEVKTLLAQSFNVTNEKVFVHSELVKAENCTEHFMDKELIKHAQVYFEEGKQKTHQPKTRNQEESSVPYMVRFLPIAILNVEKPIQTRKAFNKEAWGLPKLPEVSLKIWAEKVFRELGDSLEVTVIPVMLDQAEVHEFYNGFIKKMENKNKKVLV